MEILVLTLIVPVLGALLLVSEWQGRVAETAAARGAWRRVLGGTGALLLPLALLGAWYALVSMFYADLLQSILLIGRLFLVCLMGWAGLRAIRVARFRDEWTVQSSAAAGGSRRADELRFSAWVLVAFPMLWLVLAALVLVAPVVYLLMLYLTARGSTRGRLLWVLAVAVEHGMPLPDEIDMLAEGSWGPSRARLRAFAGRLRDGKGLAEALESDPWLLPGEMTMAVRVGEQTGTLPLVLREEAVRYSTGIRRARLDGSLAALISYYWTVTLVLAVTMAFIGYWIIPKFKSIFADFDLELPPLTQRVIGASDWMMAYIWILLPLLCVPVTLLLLLSAGQLAGALPRKFSPLMRWFPRRDSPGVLRAIAKTVGRQRQLPEVLADAAAHHPRRDMGQRLKRIAAAIAAGDRGWRCLANEGLITRREMLALDAAQRARHLPFAMEALADSLEQNRRRRMLSWIEWCKPCLILVLGWLVGLYCAAIFMPLVAIINTLVERIQ